MTAYGTKKYDYWDMNLEYEENSHQEILEATIEMIEYINKDFDFLPTPLQMKYNNIFYDLNIEIKNNNYVCDSFLKSNKYLIE